MEEEHIEEGSVRLLGSSIGSSSGRWVDGSEVDSDSPAWSLFDESPESREGYGGSVRRRLLKKPKRVDSFDVKAMEISGFHNHHSSLLGSFPLSNSGIGISNARNCIWRHGH